MQEVQKEASFDFYSNLVQKLEMHKELINGNQKKDFVINLESMKLNQRFVCLTGESETENCELMIDVVTGYLYSPKWFSEQVEKENWSSDPEALAKNIKNSNLNIAGIEDWEVSENFENDIFQQFSKKDGFVAKEQKVFCDFGDKENPKFIPMIISKAFVDWEDGKVWGMDYTYPLNRFANSYKKYGQFICLTGESEKECQLLLDTKTGYLYSPKWFNENGKTFVEKNNVPNSFFSNISISDINGWKLPTVDIFKNFQPKERVKFFQQKELCIDHNNNNNNYNYFYRYFIQDNDSQSYGYQLYPFIYNLIFSSLGIWGENINFTLKELNLPLFKKFLKSHNFNPKLEIISQDFQFPQEDFPKYQKVPKLLKELEQKHNIVLHTEKIVFPFELFDSNSEIEKFENLIKYIDFLQSKIDVYSEKNSEKIESAYKLFEKFSSIKTESESLQKVQNFILNRYDFSFKSLENQLANLKSETLEYLSELDNQAEQNLGKNLSENGSIFDFTLNTKTLDFKSVGKLLTRSYNNQIDKLSNQVSNFSDEVIFLDPLFETLNQLSQTSQDFHIGQKEKLKLECKDNSVPESVETIWSEWVSQVDEIENRYLPLIQSFFDGKISKDRVFEIFDAFSEYRNSVDNFFLTKRIEIVQEYFDNAKSDWLQKAEMTSQLFKTTSNFTIQVQSIIEKESDSQSKKLINSQSESLTSALFKQTVDFLQSSGFEENITNQFLELQQRNLDIYLSDVIQYNAELEKRNSDINKLMFKMKQELRNIEISKLQNSQNIIDVKVIENKPDIKSSIMNGLQNRPR